MIKVLIVYATDYGSTEKAAQTVAEGVMTIDSSEATIKKADDVTADDVKGADALVLGSPVHMGSPDWRVKKFIDTVCSGLWMENKVIGKVGAVFTTGSGYGNSGGGAELCQLALMSNLAELGMVMVGLPKSTPGYEQGGLQWGPHARAHHEDLKPGALTDERLQPMRHHGMHIARITQRLAGANPFTG
jgi:NAD(P)H dehydrogenase (quinone)